MRIGTWNVEYGFGTRNPDRLAKLQAHPADVWVLTETHRDLDLSATHTAVSSEARQGRKEGSTWVTIWSRFSLLRPLAVPNPRRMVAAVFDSPLGLLAVAGVVLPWHTDAGEQPSEPPPRNWDEHRRVVRNEVPRLLQTLKDDAPECRVVLAGDFNMNLARPYSYGLVSERRELLRMLGETFLVCHTSEVRYPPPSPDQTLIDHVCTDWGPAKGVETWAGKDGGRPRLSDHPGVVVTLPDPPAKC